MLLRDNGRSTALQAVPVCHRDAACDAADDTNKTLVSTADEQVLQMRAAIKLLIRRAIYGAIVVAGKTHNRGGCKHVGVDHVAPIVGHEPHRRFGDSI